MSPEKSDILFVGDVAAPGNTLVSWPKPLLGYSVIVNLEGPVLTSQKNEGMFLYNDESTIKWLKNHGAVVVCLANNHINDINDDMKTIKSLQENSIKFTGIDNDYAILHDENKNPIYILNFGWDVIGCSNKPYYNCNLIDHDIICEQAKKLKLASPSSKIYVVMHWNYELEIYPQPADRLLARDLIDAGVECIIGHHPHIVSGYEKYNGKYIFYSLGNWNIRQDFFFSGSLRYPDSCKLQYALAVKNSKIELHEILINPFNASLEWKQKINVEKLPDFDHIQNFGEINITTYSSWFKKYRKKRFLLPIFYSHKNTIRNRLCKIWIKVRHKIILLSRPLTQMIRRVLK